MQTEILIAGFGGQGVLFGGQLIAYAGMDSGKEVTWIPSYGPEMRGGTANCSVVISDDVIGSPVINDADVLIALNQPSLEKFEEQLKPGGIIIIDSSLIKVVPQRTDIRFIPIASSEIANELGNMAYATIVLLGCLSAATGCFKRESFEAALREVLPERRYHIIPSNLDAFDKGAAFA